HTTVSTTGTGTAGSTSPGNHKQVAASGHALPKTGENSSWLILAGQMLLLMAMKLFYKKRSLD
ncbi:LPXTG cell wall anchor domain-containing protein, partial [Klebsiella pneumoniae]|nr:LPXTG cell wall anchor domain-containing protein [Klebsiella pneumoniae]